MSSPSAKRHLQSARQRAYRARVREGFRSHRLDADPLDVAEILQVAHISLPPNPDQQALNAGLTELVRLLMEDRLRLLVVRAEE